MVIQNNFPSFELIILATQFSRESFTFKLGAKRLEKGHSKSDGSSIGVSSVIQNHERASMF